MAISLLGAVAAAELIAVSIHAIRSGSEHVIAAAAQPKGATAAAHGSAVPASDPARMASAQTSGRISPSPSAAASALDPTLAAEAERQLIASIPRPTPVPLRREITPAMRVNDLVNLARNLRDRGDTSTALTRLREAQVISPHNSEIISEMALTYEKMGLTDKAITQWRRIYEMGENAGIYYAAAEAKLRTLELPPDTPVPPAAARSPLAAGGLQSDTAVAGATLTLGNVGTVDDTGNSQPYRKLKLRVPINAKAGSHVDVRDVVIQVFFYDQLKDGSVVETNANVSSEWSSAPIDWASPSEPEVLDVEYAQSEPSPNDPHAKEARNYFGYEVRVYYKGDLNDTRAEPVKLLKQFPPPATVSASSASDLPQ